jgi:hypothetical protein
MFDMINRDEITFGYHFQNNLSVLEELSYLQDCVIELQQQLLLKDENMRLFRNNKKKKSKKYDEDVAVLIPLPDNLLCEKIDQEVKNYYKNIKGSKEDLERRQWVKSNMPK